MARNKKSGERSDSDSDVVLQLDIDELEPGKELTPEGQEVYHVEAITAARVVVEEDGGNLTWEYRIKWAFYPDNESSWEPVENVHDCTRLVNSFWDHVGPDNKDYMAGYEVHAKKWWIKKEMDYFRRHFVKSKPKKDKKEKGKEKVAVKGNASKVTKNDKDKESSKVDPTANGKSENMSTIVISSESDSDDDKPLLKVIKNAKAHGRKRVHLTSSGSEEPLPKLQKKDVKSDVRTASISSKTITARSPSPMEGLFGDRDSSPEVSLVAQPSTPKKVNEPPAATQKADAIRNPITKPNATAVARPKTIGIPIHRQRKDNPQVKQIDLPAANMASGSALSTKARLAQGTATASVPGNRPGFAFRKGNLVGLNFRKTSLPKQPTLETSPQPVIQAKKPASTPKEVVEIPSIARPKEDAEMPSQTDTEPALFLPMDDDSPENSSLENQANDFLFDMMPVQPAALFLPVAEETVVRKVKPAAMARIPKKWKWSGELFVNIAADKAERLCEVTIQEPTENRADGMQFSFFFQNNSSIRLKKLHEIADLGLILLSCNSAQQFAHLVPKDENNKNALETLSKYMASRKKVTYSTLSFLNELEVETDVVALMLVVPPLETLHKRLNVPDYMRQDAGLLVALLPLKLKTSRYRVLQWRKPLPQSIDKDTVSLPDRTIKSDVPYANALGVLRFPRWLHDFIPNREYCVWFAPEDGTYEKNGIEIRGKTETKALITILERNGAKNVGYKAATRIVFVHVGALKTLHRLEAFCERRFKRPELQFIAYGSHPTLPRNRWGIREIYVLGGIVTFTPNAIVSDIRGVRELIDKLNEHDLWACYILPSAMGLAMRLVEESYDSETREFIFGDIVQLIQDGKISLLNAPPVEPSTPELSRIFRQLAPLEQPAALMEECRTAFNAKYANLSPAESQSAILEEISQDVYSMQLQPNIMDNYRRYVVITSVEDRKMKDGDAATRPLRFVGHDWLEWQTVSSFEFKDDFFKES